MKRRSNTKPPHDPHVLYLDEDTSGDKLALLLRQGRISVDKYEKLLPRNKKIADGEVIECASKANCVLVTKDKRMETLWVADIIRYRAKVILLTDEEGGPINWASALICSQSKWNKVLLENLYGPVTIRVDGAGGITKVCGEADLKLRRNHLLTASISRSKRHTVQSQRTRAVRPESQVVA